MKIINVDNIYAWVILISSISQVIITGWTFSQCFKIRISKVLFTALIILVSCIAIVPPTFFQIYFPIKAAVLFILVFVVFKLSSESDFVKPFIFLCLDMLVNITLEMLLLMTVTFIGINDFQDVNDVYTFNRMISSLMFTVICIPFKYLIALLWNRIVNKSTSSRLNLSLILFPAAQTFAMVGMVADHAGNADAKQHPMVQANSTLVLTISFLTFLVADIVYLYFMADLEKKAALNRPLTYNIQTFGCQMNSHDSEKLKGIMDEIGYEEVDDEAADFVIFNTCTIRENANQKLYGHLGHVKTLKNKNKDMIVCLCGCMMQEPHVIETLKQKYKFVNIIFGTHNIYKLAELIYSYLETGKQTIEVLDETKQTVEQLPRKRKYTFKSGVNIMYGCNNFCTYCIVPYVRGREQSRKKEEILAEVEALAKQGISEVMLLGQNVNSYGNIYEYKDGKIVFQRCMFFPRCTKVIRLNEQRVLFSLPEIRPYKE